MAQITMSTQRYQTELFAQLEAILMITDEPVTVEQLVKATGEPAEHIEATLRLIQRDYDGTHETKTRGFQLRHVAGGWRINTRDRKSTRLNSSHVAISYAVFCLKKKNNKR